MNHSMKQTLIEFYNSGDVGINGLADALRGIFNVEGLENYYKIANDEMSLEFVTKHGVYWVDCDGDMVFKCEREPYPKCAIDLGKYLFGDIDGEPVESVFEDKLSDWIDTLNDTKSLIVPVAKVLLMGEPSDEEKMEKKLSSLDGFFDEMERSGLTLDARQKSDGINWIKNHSRYSHSGDLHCGDFSFYWNSTYIDSQWGIKCDKCKKVTLL